LSLCPLSTITTAPSNATHARQELRFLRAKNQPKSKIKHIMYHNLTNISFGNTNIVFPTPTIKTKLNAAFQIMTDVAAVVAAAAGSRGIGFQGKLVS
jgi:hypothetical protein